jgi:hypothetical protein
VYVIDELVNWADSGQSSCADRQQEPLNALTLAKLSFPIFLKPGAIAVSF